MNQGNELVLIRHSDGPADDRVFTYARQNGFMPIEKFPFRGDLIGNPSDRTAGTIVYGGMFNVFEEEKNPFLKEEARWLKECMESDLPILGLCQGAQQIARLLGANVGPKDDNRHEFGYYEVSPTKQGKDFLNEPLFFTQAHFHTFDIPKGGVHLARSDAFANQAFRYGDNVFGFQFHPECTIEGFRRWQRNSPSENTVGVQSIAQQNRLMMEHDEAQAKWFYHFMKKLFGRVSD